MIHRFMVVLVRFLSERDGTPSASRLTMGWLAVVSGVVLVTLTVGILKSDLAKAAAILGSLPLIIAALAALIVSPYSVNRFTEDKQKQIPQGPDSNLKPGG